MLGTYDKYAVFSPHSNLERLLTYPLGDVIIELDISLSVPLHPLSIVVSFLTLAFF